MAKTYSFIKSGFFGVEQFSSKPAPFKNNNK